MTAFLVILLLCTPTAAFNGAGRVGGPQTQRAQVTNMPTDGYHRRSALPKRTRSRKKWFADRRERRRREK